MSGKVGAGKDEIASYLNRKYNYTIFRYADNLKHILTYGGWDSKKDLRGRKLLQDVGKAFRKWDPDHWVKWLLKDIEYVLEYGVTNICIADARHVNEIEYFKEKWLANHPDSKFLTIRVIGPNHDELREMDSETLSDSSETDLDYYVMDYYVNNTQTLDNLYHEIDSIVNAHF